MAKRAKISWMAGALAGVIASAFAACSSPKDGGSSTVSGMVTSGSSGATSNTTTSASSSGGNASSSSAGGATSASTGAGGAGGSGAAPPVIVQITAGDGHSCGLTKAGTVYCWGCTVLLGNAAQVPPLCLVNGAGAPPTLVAGLDSVAEVRAGGAHTCARKTDGTVLCWGNNKYGQLGDGTTMEFGLTPTLVPNLAGVTVIAAAGVPSNEHTCALKTDGTVLCWGSNQYGELGAASKDTCGDNKPCSTTPLVVQGITGVKALSLAAGTTCATKTDGTVWCWGYNFQATPAQTQNSFATTFLAIGVGNGAPICGIRSDGMVMCWEGGGNAYGELGCGKFYGACPYDTSKNPIPDLTGVAQLTSGGWHHMHARKTDGTVVGWGANIYVSLGDGTGANQPSPVQIPGLKDIVDIAGGFEHGCALDKTGAVWCWGLNWAGQAGDKKYNMPCGGQPCIVTPAQVKF
jgi:alpha-tubulin suppressor-like RCC1 family protein